MSNSSNGNRLGGAAAAPPGTTAARAGQRRQLLPCSAPLAERPKRRPEPRSPASTCTAARQGSSNCSAERLRIPLKYGVLFLHCSS